MDSFDADHVLRGWDNDLDEARLGYPAELMRVLQPTAFLSDQLAGLDLPAEQARATRQALQAAERQSYPDQPVPPRSTAALGELLGLFSAARVAAT